MKPTPTQIKVIALNVTNEKKQILCIDSKEYTHTYQALIQNIKVSSKSNVP